MMTGLDALGSPDSRVLDAREEASQHGFNVCKKEWKAGPKAKYERMGKAGLDWGRGEMAITVCQPLRF